MPWQDTIYGQRWVPDVNGLPEIGTLGGAIPNPANNATAAERSARALIQGTLEEFGLGGLADRMWEQYLNGAPLEQIFLDLRKTPEWKAQYGVIDQLAAKGRAISEQEVIGLRRQFSQVARAAGLPPGFYDSNDDFDRYIAGEVSPSEYNDRVQLAARAAYQSPPEFRQEMEKLYGITPGDLTAYWMDPDKALPLVQQRFIAAQTSTAARRSGFGALTLDEAERLAGAGVTEAQANQGFSQLAANSELFGALPGEAANDITRGEQLAATFDNNAAAQERIRRRQEQRAAAGRGGGSFAAGRTGVAGLGTRNA